MDYSSEEDRHSGTFPVTTEGSDTDSSPLRIMSCRNRAKFLVHPLSNRHRAPILDIPATVGDQGFTVRNQHKASAPISQTKEKGKGLAPPETVEDE